MLRHRSYWVWVGEFLHPHEYADRYPNIARAFQVVRKKSKDGVRAPAFQGWYSRLERTFRDRDLPRILAVLSERPGEFARRLDFALRIAGDDAQASDAVVAAFTEIVSELATPFCSTLASHTFRLARRRRKCESIGRKAEWRRADSTADNRDVLTERTASATVRVIHSGAPSSRF